MGCLRRSKEIETPYEVHLQEGRASARPLLRFRCVGCGYGASSRQAPDRCPMCGRTAWEDEGWKPFADLGIELAVVARRAARGAGFDADAPLVRESTELSVFPGVPLS